VVAGAVEQQKHQRNFVTGITARFVPVSPKKKKKKKTAAGGVGMFQVLSRALSPHRFRRFAVCIAPHSAAHVWRSASVASTTWRAGMRYLAQLPHHMVVASLSFAL